MQVLGAVHQVFVDAGFEEQDALVRAVTFFAAGMGFLHGFGGHRTAAPTARTGSWTSVLRP